jgi:hypothetical protein
LQAYQPFVARQNGDEFSWQALWPAGSLFPLDDEQLPFSNVFVPRNTQLKESSWTIDVEIVLVESDAFFSLLRTIDNHRNKLGETKRYGRFFCATSESPVKTLLSF